MFVMLCYVILTCGSPGHTFTDLQLEEVVWLMQHLICTLKYLPHCPARYHRVCEANDQLAAELREAHEVLYELQVAASMATPALERQGTRALLQEQQQVGLDSSGSSDHMNYALKRISDVRSGNAKL